jgi:hypothetical protein
LIEANIGKFNEVGAPLLAITGRTNTNLLYFFKYPFSDHIAFFMNFNALSIGPETRVVMTLLFTRLDGAELADIPDV